MVGIIHKLLGKYHGQNMIEPDGLLQGSCEKLYNLNDMIAFSFCREDGHAEVELIKLP